MLVRMAWRNLWRNRRRTFIAVGALTLGAAAIVLTHSFTETMYGSMIDLATRGLLGHLQVHGKGFQADPDIFTAVKDPAAVREVVSRVLPGAVALSRVSGFGLAAAGERSTGVAIIGLVPADELAHSEVLRLSAGRMLSSTPSREVLLSEAVARKLHVAPGGELVLLSQAADGSIANDLFTVVGLSAGAGSVESGGAAVFVHLGDAQQFFVLGQAVHQVAVTVPRGVEPRAAAAALRAQLDPSLEALAWNEMLPDVERTIEADREGSYLMDLVVFLLVVLGMLNAMTMATFERTYELGVLSAVGTRPLEVMAMIVLESLMLGLLSLAGGLALASLVIAALPPIDFGASLGSGLGDFGGMALPTVITVRLAPLAAAMAVGTVAFTSFVGGLYPAWRASRLRPVEAMRSRA